ncbi:hypothetical protein [Legionella sp.]|uniref:hypothetical protein n=1 Tax=Legionella sp. TaxID=459 RepID=UPI003C959F71
MTVENNVAAQINSLLGTYQSERSKRYRIKDIFFPTDKKTRNQFISQLKGSLNTGKKEGLLDLIKDNINKFPGLHLTTTLYKIRLLLVDESSNLNVSTEAKKRLIELGENEYTRAINTLYSTIEKLKVFAGSNKENPIAVFANQLKNDVDQFVSSNTNYSQLQLANRFQTKFIARLHSEDILMSQHEHLKPFIINLVLAVVTLGLALAIKAVHSKWTTGRVSLFASETPKQAAIKKIGQAVDELLSLEPSYAEKVFAILGIDFFTNQVGIDLFTNQDLNNLSKTCRTMNSVALPELNKRAAKQLLNHVLLGQQKEAEAMIKMNPKLQLMKSIATDYSGRTFNCTAYEYAYWAKDTHMCRMLERHMDEETKADMLVRIDANDTAGLSYQQNSAEHRSAHFDLAPLKTALQAHVDGYSAWYNTSNWDAMEAAWLVVSKAQRDVPAHVVQEYCRPDRSFYPCPSFNELTLPRGLTFYNWTTSQIDSWFPLVPSNSDLNFGLIRAAVEGLPFGLKVTGSTMPFDAFKELFWIHSPSRTKHFDLAAITRLDEVRTDDLRQSRKNLNSPTLAPGMAR